MKTIFKLFAFALALIAMNGLVSCSKPNKKTRSNIVTCDTYSIVANDSLAKWDTICVYTQQINTSEPAQSIEDGINNASTHQFSYVDCH